MTNEVINKLSEAALDVRKKAYCPYSGFAVGAALLAKSGEIYTGVNIENAAFTPTNCAERTAFFTAIAKGERDFVAVAIAGGKADEEPEDFVVTGPNMLTALPQTVSLSYSEIAYALEKSLTKIDAALMKVLESMPPELYADIVKNGIYLAGGGALIKGLDRRLNEKTGIPFHIAEDPLRAIARGTGIALKNINRFSFLMK